MKHLITSGASFALTILLLPCVVYAQEQVVEIPVRYDRGVVVRIQGEGVRGSTDAPEPYQDVLIKLTSGPEAGRNLELDYRDFSATAPEQKLAAGDHIIITRSVSGDLVQYYIADRYRLPALGWLLLAFLALGVLLGRKRGTGAILGLVASIAILGWLVVPAIAQGSNPLLVGVGGAIAIATGGIYLAHGISRRTTVALAGTVLTLIIAAGAAVLAMHTAHLLGLGDDAAYFLQFSELGSIDLRGILLAGILIGTIGVLDDITTTQAAIVDELRHANPNLGNAEVYRRALRVGREHIASLINTLALAYVGASLPLLLFITAGTSGAPLWVTANSEMVAEEVVRMLVGSAALMLAVPLTTYLAVQMLHPAAISSKK